MFPDVVWLGRGAGRRLKPNGRSILVTKIMFTSLSLFPKGGESGPRPLNGTLLITNS
jgi:hypothetical protein